MIGKVFGTKSRFRGVITVSIDIPKERYTESLAPEDEVEIVRVKK